jgi:hypothetical protein
MLSTMYCILQSFPTAMIFHFRHLECTYGVNNIWYDRNSSIWWHNIIHTTEQLTLFRTMTLLWTICAFTFHKHYSHITLYSENEKLFKLRFCQWFSYKKPSFKESSIFWDTTLYSPLKVNWSFGGTCHLHLQGRRVSRAWNQHEAGGKQS